MITTYFFNKANRTETMSLQRQAFDMITAFFDKNKSLLGKPVFSITPDKVIVQLFYYTSGKPLSNAGIATLGNALTRCWGRTVELRLVQLHHGTLDSSIFAQYLTTNTNKYSFNRILDMIKNNVPTVLSDILVEDNTTEPLSQMMGVKIKLSGRLTTQRSGPRQTVQAGRLGTSAKGQLGTVDYSQYTAKNKLGAFTMKVWISQQSR